MPPKRKAKQTTRATPGKAPRHTRLSAALGAPPPPSTSVDFEDAEELQEIVAAMYFPHVRVLTCLGNKAIRDDRPSLPMTYM